jgi:hypothetical protein
VLESLAVFRSQCTAGVDHQCQKINSLERLSDLGHHVPSEDRAGAMYSGRIDEHNLRVWTIDDSEDAISRSLRLRGHNRHFLPHEPVYERRLSGVGLPQDCDEPGTK